MSKKKLSTLEQKLKKLGLVAKAYTDSIAAAGKVNLIEQATAESGFLKTYILAAGVNTESAVTAQNLIGKINIPKDFLVKSGVVATVATADAPYTGAVVGDKYLDFTVNTVGDDATAQHIYIPVKDLVDIYTGSNAIDVSNSNVISIILNATASGLVIDANGLAIKLDSSNSNGLALTAAGLKLALATQSTAGAMSAADKVIVDKALTSDDIALLSDNEIGSWFGMDATTTATALTGFSDDSITDEE
ncbi:MAG: hypothetical protein K6F89_06335 [Prevotella sp.]|nr:hypothetical protein [Prevotella sp.]